MSAPSVADPVGIAERVVALLVDRVYRAARERDLQDGIQYVLGGSGFRVEREYRLSARDRPDFLVEGCVAVEVKMRANGSAVLSQLARYAADRRVQMTPERYEQIRRSAARFLADRAARRTA